MNNNPVLEGFLVKCAEEGLSPEQAEYLWKVAEGEGFDWSGLLSGLGNWFGQQNPYAWGGAGL